MITIKNLTKSYDKNVVLENINLVIPTGSIFGLVGINGSGKSTLLRLLSGVFVPDSGQIYYDEELFSDKIIDIAKLKSDIFFLPDEPYYSTNTTPKSLLKIYEPFYKLDKTYYFSYLDSVKIPHNKPMNSFSKGMKRQVFIALAFAIKPKYLFLDEAFDGLDPLSRLNLKKEIIRIQNERDITIIISSHSLRELTDICDSYGILNNKNFISTGETSTVETKYHKYTVGFNEEYQSFDFSYIKVEINKHFATFITTDDYETFQEKISKYGPIIIDEFDVDFEEFFLAKITSMEEK